MNRRAFLSRSSLLALVLTRLAPSLQSVEGTDRAREPQTIFQQVRAGRGLVGVDAIDTHAHFDEVSGDLIWPLSLGRLEADSRRCGIGLTIVSPFEGFMATSPDQLTTAHDACVKAIAKYGNLRAYLVFQPHLLKTSVAEMQRILEPKSPFVGFKLHGGIDQYAADGPNYQPLFEFANKHRMHVLYHAWGGVDRVGSVAKKYPQMTLTLAHMGLWSGSTASEVMAVLKEHPNLSVDTCSSVSPYGYLEMFVRTVGAEKILFATDCTYLAPGPQIAKVAFANISEDEKRLIFGGNARRILGDRLPALRLRPQFSSRAPLRT
jgi:uncharacterized protein